MIRRAATVITCLIWGIGRARTAGLRAITTIENGKRRLTEATIIRVANVLGIPASKLGFRYWVTVEPTGQEGSWVERRDFGDYVIALSLGVNGLDWDRLTALLPQAESPGTRHLGAADVETIDRPAGPRFPW